MPPQHRGPARCASSPTAQLFPFWIACVAGDASVVLGRWRSRIWRRVPCFFLVCCLVLWSARLTCSTLIPQPGNLSPNRLDHRAGSGRACASCSIQKSNRDPKDNGGMTTGDHRERRRRSQHLSRMPHRIHSHTAPRHSAKWGNGRFSAPGGAKNTDQNPILTRQESAITAKPCQVG